MYICAIMKKYYLDILTNKYACMSDSLVSSVVNNEFNAPKKDSKPIVPNLALYISSES